MRPSLSSTNSSASAGAANKPAAGGGGGLSGFDDLWASSSGSGSASGANKGGKKTMADLAKEKSGAGVWGTTATGMAQAPPAQGAQGQKKDLFDLL